MKVSVFFKVESGFERFDTPNRRVIMLEECGGKVEGEKLVLNLSQNQSLETRRFEQGEEVSVKVGKTVVNALIEYDTNALTNRRIIIVPGGQGVHVQNVERVIR